MIGAEALGGFLGEDGFEHLTVAINHVQICIALAHNHDPGAVAKQPVQLALRLHAIAIAQGLRVIDRHIVLHVAAMRIVLGIDLLFAESGEVLQLH
ncbi:hypothetical protein D3C75_965790 [compost metagenome]